MSQELRLKSIYEKRYYFYEEIKEKEFMSGTPKKVCKLYWTLS